MYMNISFKQIMIFVSLVTIHFSGLLCELKPNTLVLLNCKPTTEKFKITARDRYRGEYPYSEETLKSGEKKSFDSSRLFKNHQNRISRVTWYAPKKDQTNFTKDNTKNTYMKLEKNNKLIRVQAKNLHCAADKCPDTTECKSDCVCCKTKKGNLCYKKGPSGNEYQNCEVNGKECWGQNS